MPMAKQTSTTDLLVTDLAAMSYPVKEAKGMVNRAAPYLRADLTEKRRCASSAAGGKRRLAMSDYDFTVDELRRLSGKPGFYSPGFSDEQFQNLVVLGKHLTDSGYLEAVRGLARLERQGVSCIKALDEFEALKRRSSELEQRASDAQVKLQSLAGELQETQREYEQAKQDWEK